MSTPATIRWERHVSDFLDGLVDLDIGYIEAQMAVETLVHAGLHDAVTIGFEVDVTTVHLHKVPALFPGMREIYVFSTVAQTGQISVIHACFSDDLR